MIPAVQDLIIVKGKTFTFPIRWGHEFELVYRPITSISQSAPVLIVSPLHGVPDGWPVAVVSVSGMTEINADANQVGDADYHPATVLNDSAVEINAINAAGFHAYTSGGYLQYHKPIDLAGCTARMSIEDKGSGTVLMSLTTENFRVVISNTTKTVLLAIDATDTEAITWKRGIYDLELINPDKIVTAVLTGKVTVADEVTTP